MSSSDSSATGSAAAASVAGGRVLPVLAVLSGIALMLPMFLAGPLVLDEHGSYWVIDSGLPWTSLTRSLEYAAIPPLSGWLQQISIALLGKSEFAFRLPSALAYLAALAVVFRAGADLRDAATGGLAALLLAWHPEAMDEVRIARCYGLVLLTSALVLLTTLRWLRNPLSFRWAVLWGLSAAGLMWTHYTSALLVATAGLWLGGSCLAAPSRGAGGASAARTSRPGPGLRPPRVLRWLTGMGLMVLLCLPLIPAVVRMKEWGPFLNYSAADPSIWNVVGPLWWLAVPAGLLVCAAMKRGSSKPPPLPRGSLALLAACALVPLILLALLSVELSSLANPRYRVAFAPAAACLIALLFTARGSFRGAGTAALVTLGTAWAANPLLPWETGRLGASSEVQWREVSASLERQARPGEPILVQSGLAESSLVPVFAEDRLFMEYVACRVSRFYLEGDHPRYGLPFLWNGRTGIAVFYQALLAALPESERQGFWVACATDTDLNRNSLAGIQRIAKEAGFHPIEEEVRPAVTLIRFARPPSVRGESLKRRGDGG